MGRTDNVSAPGVRTPDRTIRMALAIAVLLVLRLILGAVLPLYYKDDEGYYWLWSQHLAWGYFDHPPVIAALIRAGTLMFGNTEFGVRVAAILLSVPATLCVWRTATLILGRTEDGARAALIFNLSLMVSSQAFFATPDAPALACSAAFVWALAELTTHRTGAWWLVAGLAAGLGLLSKYTMFFMGLGAMAWLLVAAEARAWLRTAWPWLGGGLAGLVFLPNLLWNADHDWVTFVFQFGRIVHTQYSWRFLPEFLLWQIVLLSPFFCVFAGLGLWRATRAKDAGSLLIAALVWPPVLYFLVHSLHSSTRQNWPSFLYPVLAVAAAEGFRNARIPGWARSASLPVTALFLAVVYAELLFQFIPLNANLTPLNEHLAAGNRALAVPIAQALAATGAHAIVTTDFPTTAWLRFYLQDKVPIIEVTEEIRYPDSPQPTAADLSGTLLYVFVKPDFLALLEQHFSEVEPLETPRPQADLAPTAFRLYRLGGFHDQPFGRIP